MGKSGFSTTDANDSQEKEVDVADIVNETKGSALEKDNITKQDDRISNVEEVIDEDELVDIKHMESQEKEADLKEDSTEIEIKKQEKLDETAQEECVQTNNQSTEKKDELHATDHVESKTEEINHEEGTVNTKEKDKVDEVIHADRA